MYSPSCTVSQGVPQGSLLGPLLFFVKTDDLPHSSDLLKVNLFPDDSTLTYSFQPINSTHTRMVVNDHLNKIDNWLSANNIRIDIDKTKYIIFSYRSKIVVPEIKYGTECIEQTNCVKFLCLCLEKNLSFTSHINLIAKKMSKSLGTLAKRKFILPANIMVNLYYSLIHPYLTYAISHLGMLLPYIILTSCVGYKRKVLEQCMIWTVMSTQNTTLNNCRGFYQSHIYSNKMSQCMFIKL